MGLYNAYAHFPAYVFPILLEKTSVLLGTAPLMHISFSVSFIKFMEKVPNCSEPHFSLFVVRKLLRKTFYLLRNPFWAYSGSIPVGSFVANLHQAPLGLVPFG